MNSKLEIARLLRSALAYVAPSLNDIAVVLERPRQSAHGDYACNIALQAAKALKRNPRELAATLREALPESALIDKVEVAGAGFLNFFLKPNAKTVIAQQVLRAGDDYGRSNLGKERKVLIEFVSANPTGPLHVGHGRGAAYGASLANILQFAGYAVAREYYINDAGRQMDILAVSTWLRYLEAHGQSVAFPPNGYQGDYVRAMAQQIHDGFGTRYVRPAQSLLEGAPALDEGNTNLEQRDAARESYVDHLIARAKQLLGEDYAYIHNHALTEQLGDCRNDLAEFGVHFDNWYSEHSLFASGAVPRALEVLERNHHTYLQDGAQWFRSTHFGDDQDRVLVRENGQFTYFAADVAYHYNKYERGFERLIDVWGADHHGYIARVKGAIQALGQDPAQLSVPLIQFVTLYRAGKRASMSTRSADYVTLRELRAEVGNDAARFFYVLHKSDQHLDFDLDLAKSQSKENPVYYVQYAHARICRVLEKSGEEVASLRAAELSALEHELEFELLQGLADFPEVVEAAANEMAPHLIAYYLKDLAARLHTYYDRDDKALRVLAADTRVRNARLALTLAVRQVLRNGLRLLGVGAPERM